MSNITVLTSITVGKDDLMEDQARGDALWIAYTDVPEESKTWHTHESYERFQSPRRNSRVPKMLSHKFTETEYSIWIDGNLKLLKTLEEIVATYLKDHDIALFKHPDRDCLYDEGIVCAVNKLDDPEVIKRQLAAYEREGYATHKGLCECNFIVRRHTPKIKALNEKWFAEYSTYSARDQISFMYAVDQVGVRLNVIEGSWVGTSYYATKADLIAITPHLTPRNDEYEDTDSI